MDRRLESWYNAIKAYLQLIDKTMVYRGCIELKDTKSLLEDMGFTDVDVDWYDGVLINAKRSGCKYSSAWCMSHHVIKYDSPKYNFHISVHERKYNPEYDERPDEPYSEPKNQYKYSRLGEVLGDIPECYMEFMKKLVEYCDELNKNNLNEIEYYVRFCLD